MRLASPNPCCGPMVSSVRNTIRSSVPWRMPGSLVDIQEEYDAVPFGCQEEFPDCDRLWGWGRGPCDANFESWGYFSCAGKSLFRFGLRGWREILWRKPLEHADASGGVIGKGLGGSEGIERRGAAGFGWGIHLSDSRLASGREGFRFSGLEVVEMKRKRKLRSA